MAKKEKEVRIIDAIDEKLDELKYISKDESKRFRNLGHHLTRHVQNTAYKHFEEGEKILEGGDGEHVLPNVKIKDRKHAEEMLDNIIEYHIAPHINPGMSHEDVAKLKTTSKRAFRDSLRLYAGVTYKSVIDDLMSNKNNEDGIRNVIDDLAQSLGYHLPSQLVGATLNDYVTGLDADQKVEFTKNVGELFKIAKLDYDGSGKSLDEQVQDLSHLPLGHHDTQYIKRLKHVTPEKVKYKKAA